jgi:drug/metabolite transporter (DMT)-like permease
MAVLLGLAAAVAYGLSDFLGGILSRRVHYAVVGLLGYGVATAALIVALVATAPPAPTPAVLALGALSGIGGAGGTLALYRGLARGRMGVVAPLSGLGTAALPVLVGVILGDRPSVAAWAGIGLALPAIWLVSTSDDVAAAGITEAASGPVSNDVADGLLAGVGFALLLVGLGLAGEESGMWPVVASEAVGTVVMAIFVLAIGRRLGAGIGRLPPRMLAAAGAIGLMGGAAVACYFLSTQAGLLSIVAVLTSLYPAVTVVLAATILREPVTRRQATGLALAAASIVLIVLG